MNQQTGRPGWLADPNGSILFFFIINLILVLSPMAFSIAPIIVPVLLLWVLANSGRNAFIMAAGAGILPYLVLGGRSALVAVVIPMIVMTAVLFYIQKRQLAWRWSLAATAGVILAGLILNGWFAIYVLGGSDFTTFTSEIAAGIRTELASAMAVEGVELPLSQQQALEDIRRAITAQFVQDLIPALAISWALIAGYLTLRFARRYLQIGRSKASHVPWFAMLRMEPLLLFAFITMATAGFVISPQEPRLGSLLFNTGYGVTVFLGAVGTLSLMWWSLSMNFRMRRKLPKIIIILFALFYFVGDWMALTAIIDSIFDFRNTSGRSLWRWITYQIGKRAAKEE